jgi:hypothetical protein
MDSMCEPQILAKTGKSVAERQRLTTDNFLELTAKAPDLPFIPVLQGWTLADYLRRVAVRTIWPRSHGPAARRSGIGVPAAGERGHRGHAAHTGLAWVATARFRAQGAGIATGC